MVFLREGICPGATAQLIQALKDQNVVTVMHLVSADVEDLAQKCSVSYKTLVAVRRVLLAQYSPFPSNGADLYEELLGSTAILSTGNQKLDSLLDSGLYTGELTEFVGAPGTGKTQVCLSLAVNISCELKQKVLYIDSTGGLTASRLLHLIQNQVDGVEGQSEALQRIEVVRVFEVYRLLDILQDLRMSFTRQVSGARSSVKAVVIDSVSAVLSSILGGHQLEGDKLCRPGHWWGCEASSRTLVELRSQHSHPAPAQDRRSGSAFREAQCNYTEIISAAYQNKHRV
ncbi:DNA repair protein RAD51 homolog 4 isoform X2 [Carcharodon carcharias]|uniref:DNA repair protein RAD51 homolog 4 isoform X2 n=1 Tax=Carcharodon carcharias TaxID=13397 RepID=UPI001B7EB68F|nr:DNA repair protein RAD51 homolog 4 isoform X2 [Carcharodon carcharias]